MDRRRRPEENERQLKLSKRTWFISCIKPNVHLFYLSQDYIAIEKILTLRTELEIQVGAS
jgi:hypothetical protein